jgi:hypothetical protein
VPHSHLPLIGVDFSSRPTRRKPITVAHGERRGAVLRLNATSSHASLESFGEWLQQPGPWLGGFDLPFGLPRELVEHLGWPTDWPALMQHYAALSREQIRATFAAFCDARPVGSKFAHRACDKPAGSSPSMKWVNPPVAYMLQAGVPLLLAAGISLPAVGQVGDPQRLAFEAYPGLLARELIGARSYKSDEAAKQTPERLIARKDIVAALEHGRSRLGLRLKLSPAQHESLVDDASGDRLDAVLCLMQAGWIAGRADYGLPAELDTLEGWIATA